MSGPKVWEREWLLVDGPKEVGYDRTIYDRHNSFTLKIAEFKEAGQARLASQAPAMARALLSVVEADNDHRFAMSEVEIRSILKAAGVLP